MQDHHIPLYENECYHIYNRGNNGDNLFYKHENYNYFLRKYDQHLSGYLETFAYCLLPNHFHLLVRVKRYTGFPMKEERDAMFQKHGISEPGAKIKPELIVSEQFRKLFIGYAKAINNQEGRTGSLFQKSFKRKGVNNQRYFNHLVYYVHSNPTHHGIAEDFRDYPYSSYGSILSDKKSKLFKHEVLNWFGSKEFYLDFHQQKQDLKIINDLIIEED